MTAENYHQSFIGNNNITIKNYSSSALWTKYKIKRDYTV